MLANTAIRALLLFFSAILFLCSAIQFNDIDPEFWILAYGLSAFVPLLLVFKRFIPQLYWLCMGLCIAALTLTLRGTITYISDFMATESIIQGMSPSKPYIEETREFIGTAVMLIFLLASRFLKDKMPSA